MAQPSSDDSSADRLGLQGSRWMMKSGRFKISRGSDDEGDIGDGLHDSVSLDSFSQDGSATPKLERDVNSSLNRTNSVFVQLQSEFAQAVARGSSASSTAPAPDSSSNRDASTQQAASSHHSSPASASLAVPPRPTSPATSQSSLGSLSVAGNEALGQWRSLGRKIEKATKLNRTLEQRNRMLKEEKRQKHLELEDYLAELEAARQATSQGQSQSGKPTALQDAHQLARLADSVQQQKLEEFVRAFNQVKQTKDKQNQAAQQPEQDKELRPQSPPPQPQQSQQQPQQQQQQHTPPKQQHTPPKSGGQQQPKGKQDIMQEEAQNAFNQIKEQQLLQQQQQQSHPQPDFADEPTRSNN